MALTAFEMKLNAYFDREMTADERASFMEELRTNAQYRWDFKLYRKMFQVMEQLEVQTPDELPERIKTEIRRLGRPAPAAVWQRPSSYALAAAAVFFVAVFLGRESQVPAPAPAVTQMAVAPVPVVAPPPAVPAVPAPAEEAGPIRVVPEGQVEVMRKGSITWTLAHAGDRIGYEDKVRTGPSGSARLEYPDRAWIKVKGESLVQVLDEAIRVYQGDTWIKVEKTGSRFEARTPNAVASVRGTMYAVHVRRLPLRDEDIAAMTRDGTTLGVSENVPTGTSNAAVSAASTQLRLAQVLWQRLRSGFATDVEVFESTVAVASLDPLTGEVGPEQLVTEGNGTEVKGAVMTAAAPLEPQDYHAWRMPVPAAVLAAARPSLPAPPAPHLPTPADEPVEATGAAAEEPAAVESDAGLGAAAAGRPDTGILGYQGLRHR